MKELVLLENGEYGLVVDVVDTIITIEKKIKELKKIQDTYKENILKAMEEYDVKEIDIPELKITRKFATTRETLDSKRFRAEHQDLYDEYINITDVKGSITIKIK